MTTTLDTVPSRIYAQYRGKPKLTAWLNICRDLGLQLSDVFAAIRKTYDIDTSSGDRLDTIGHIVVLSREFEGKVVMNPYRWGYGPSVCFGGQNIRFIPETIFGKSDVADDIYRILIKAKISKNNNSATIEGILQTVRFITDVSLVYVVDNEDMSFRLEFGEILNPITRFCLQNFDIIPKPQGVRLSGYIELPYVTYWGGSRTWGGSTAYFNNV